MHLIFLVLAGAYLAVLGPVAGDSVHFPNGLHSTVCLQHVPDSVNNKTPCAERNKSTADADNNASVRSVLLASDSFLLDFFDPLHHLRRQNTRFAAHVLARVPHHYRTKHPAVRFHTNHDQTLLRAVCSPLIQRARHSVA